MRDREPLSRPGRVRVLWEKCRPPANQPRHGWMHPIASLGLFPGIMVYNVVRGAIGPAVSPHTLPNCFKYNGWLESQNWTFVPVVLSEAAQHRGRRGLFRHRRIPRRKVLTSWMFTARHEPLQGGPRCSFVLSRRPMVRSVYRELSLRDRLYRAVGYL